MSSSTKSIIGGVIGGIGGAALLGALAVVAWRVWGRKKHIDEDEYDPNKDILADKTSSVDGQTPFRSTLDQYHHPGPVNTASNF